jgi:hypothetical protein
VSHYELWDLATLNLIDATTNHDEILAAVLWYADNEPSMVKDLGALGLGTDDSLTGDALLARARQLPADTYAAILDRWTREEEGEKHA